MKLQDQVCTLEQAMRLKELGVRQQSVACFIGEELHLFEKSFYNWAEQKGMNAVAAFTVAELGIMLGQYWEHELIVAYEFETDNEAIERAHMLIGALQSNQLTTDEVNARLCA